MAADKHNYESSTGILQHCAALWVTGLVWLAVSGIGTTSGAREAVVLNSSPGEPASALVATDCAYSIAPTNRLHNYPAEDGVIAVTAPAGCAWTVDNTNDWIFIRFTTNGLGSGSVRYSAFANVNPFPRSAVITVAGQLYEVDQLPAPCTYSILPTNQLFGVQGDSGQVRVYTADACPWTLSNTNSWITIGSVSNGVGGAAIDYQLATSYQHADRTGVVAVAGNFLTVRQLGNPCSYTVTASPLSFAYGLGTGSSSITTGSGCLWDVINTNAWLILSAPAQGVGSWSFPFTVMTNHSSIARTGVVNIAGHPFTFSQGGSPCFYSISPTNRMHGYLAETGLVVVTAVDGCPWTIQNTNSWIALASSTNAPGSGTVGYQLSANPGPPRSGTLVIAGKQFFVAQTNAIAPAIIASPPSQNVAAGTTVSLNVGATGSAPLGYQWQFNGANLTDGGNITGAAAPTLALSGVQGWQAGTYTVVVSNVRGAVTSAPPALLVVNTPPLLRSIGTKTVCPGAPLVFRALAVDVDLPAQTMTYRLGAGAPSGAGLDPSTGLFLWPSASGEGVRQVVIQVTDTGLPPLTSTQAVTINVVSGFSTNVPLVPAGSIWSYRDTGEDLGTAWTGSRFDDSAWKSGPAKFGYGNGNEATIVSYGTNASAKYVTTYFRRAFNVENIFTTGALRVKAVRDAGFILYLNGSELYRDNMPSGPVTALTLASSNVLSSDRNIYFSSPLLDPGGLLPGRNVLAVELHRQSASTSTLGFDLELSASETLGSPVIVEQPQSQSIPEGASASLSLTAVGAPPLRLQWYFNGAPLPNATNATLSVANAVAAQSGAYFAVLSNYLGSASSEVVGLTVTPNAPPVLGPIGDQMVLLGRLLVFSASAADADFPPQSLAFSLDPGAPAGAAINPSTGLFTWAPTVAQGTGANTVTVRVTDDGFPPLSAAQVFTITVLAPNVTPVLAPIANKVLVSGASLSFTISAADANFSQTLAYSLDAAPAGASLNPATGLFTWTAPAQGSGANIFKVRVTDNGSPPLSDTRTFTISVIPAAEAGVTTNVTLVPAGSVWKYLDTGQDLGTAWAGLAYNDSAWPSGPAILGYAGGSEATVVGYGPNSSAKYITTYFRRSFTVASPSAFNTLSTQVRRDDGVVVYINGTEVFRDNMPAGPINYLTPSPISVSGTNKTSYHPSPAFGSAMLVPGANVIAAEVHQHSGSSTSMDFDLLLGGLAIGGNNTPPVLGAIPDQSVLAGSQLTFTVSAADADSPAQSLTFSLDPGAPGGATINPATGLFAWTPAPALGPGTYAVTVRVTDNGSPSLSSVQSFTITILAPSVSNVAPVLVPIGNKTVLTGALLSFTASATDANSPVQNLTYSLAMAPVGASINPATGLFIWTPAAAQAPSTNSVTVRVTDSGSPPLSVSQTFIITVLAPNVAPALAPVGNKVVLGGDQLSFTFSAKDANVPAKTLTYSLVAAPPGASLDPVTGLFTWTTPATQRASTNILTVRVTDNAPPPLSAFQDFTITVVPPNVAPVLAPIGSKAVVSGQTLSFTISASDSNVPAQTLTYGLDAAPAGASLNPATGLFTWTPAAAVGLGVNTVKVHVTDDGSPPLNAFQSFTITVLASNIPPVLAPVGNKVVVGGTPLSFTVSATDASGPDQALNYSLDTAPAGASLHPISGVFAWTPPALLGSSTNRVTLRVTDTGSPPLSDVRTFTITVIPPKVTGVTTNVTLVPAGSVWKYRDTGQDLGTAWAGLAYDDSAWASGPAVLGYAGGSEATVVGYGANASAKYITTYFRRTFTVAAPSTFGNLSTQVRRDDGVVVYLNGTEVFRDNMPAGPVNYLTPSPVSVSGTNKTSYHPSPAFAPAMLVPGINVIAAEVHQHSGSSSSMDFDLLLSGMMIGSANTAPVLAPIGNQTVFAGNLLTISTSAADADSPAQNLTFSLDPGAPVGASIDPATGLFTWAPTFFQGPDTNLVTIRVTDDGSPAMSDFSTFAITVNDVNRVELVIAATNATPGSQVSLPIEVKRFANIATFQGALHWDPSVATFLAVEQLGLADLNFGMEATNQGILTLSWDDVTGMGQTLPGGSAVLAVRFQLAAQPGLASAVWINGTPTTLEVGDADLAEVPVIIMTGQVSTAATNANSSAITITSSPPVLNMAITSGGVVFLSWQAAPGQAYRVQYTADLSSGVWTTLGPDVIAQGNSAWVYDVTGSTRQRFYRVLRWN